MVSKSVKTIDASFEKAAEFQLNDLRLSEDEKKDVFGKSSLGLPEGSKPDLGDEGFLGQLDNLDINVDGDKVKQQIEEEKVKAEAEKRFEEQTKSNLNPFKSNQSNQISNLGFSKLNEGEGGVDQDKTILDVLLPPSAKNDLTPEPSMDLGAMKQLDKAPERLPLNMSYVPTEEYKKGDEFGDLSKFDDLIDDFEDFSNFLSGEDRAFGVFSEATIALYALLLSFLSSIF